MLPTISNASTLNVSRSKTYGTKLKSSSSPLPKEIRNSTPNEHKLPSINVSILLSSPVRSAYEKYLDAPKSMKNAVDEKSDRPGGKALFLTEVLHHSDAAPESVLASEEQVQQNSSDFIMTLDRVKELFDPKTSQDTFHYYVPLRSRDGYGNIYHVTRASNIETHNQDVYLTLSLFGVTQFVDGVPEYFDSIERYKREVLCFDNLKKLNLFCRYRLMKTFGLWKQAFRHRRVQMNTRNLATCWRFERITLQILLIELREQYSRLVPQMNLQLIAFDFPESLPSFFDKIDKELSELMVCVHKQFQETEGHLSQSLHVFLNEGLSSLSETDPFRYTAWRKVCKDEDIANSCLKLCDEMVSDFHLSMAISLATSILQCLGTGSNSESQLGFQVHLKVEGGEAFVSKTNALGKSKNGLFKFELDATSEDSFEVVPKISEFTERYDAAVDHISELAQFPCKFRDKKISLPISAMSVTAVGRVNTAKFSSKTQTPHLQQQRRQESSESSTKQFLEKNVVMLRSTFVARLEPSFQLVNQLSDELQTRRIALKDFRHKVINLSREQPVTNRILDLETLLQEGHVLMDEFTALPDSRLCGEFLVNCVDAKQSLTALMPSCFDDICVAMLTHFSTTLKSTLDIAVEFTECLAETTTIEQFMSQNEMVLNFRTERPVTVAKTKYAKMCHEVCKRHLLDISAVDSAMSSILDEEFEKMEFCIEMFEANYEDNFIKFGNTLEHNARSIQERVFALKASIDDETFDKETEFANICQASIAELKIRHDEVVLASQELINQQKFFNQPESHFEGIVEVGTLIQFKLTVWNLITDLNVAIKKLSPQLVEKIDLKHFDALGKKFQDVILAQTLQFELFERLKLRVSAFIDMLRIVKACQCPDLKPEHWDKLEIILGIRIDRENASGHSQPFTFQSLVISSANQSTKEVVEVAHEAQQQNACKIKFDGIRESWSNCDFVVVPYKGKYDVFCLEKTDVIQHLLDNSLIELNQLMSSPYAKIIKPDVQELLNKLKGLSETFHILLALEAGWLHLEPIFNVGDIQRSLPSEFKLYSSTDRFRKGFLKSVLQFHNVIRNLVVTGFTESLKKQVDNLDRVSAGLKSYIATKRAAFPRFYFASDSDLLSVMSKYKQYDAISEYINFFFRGIGSVQIIPDSEASVVAMVSTRGEVVPLLRPSKLRGTPDAWLNDMEESMQKKVSASIKDAVATYQDQILDRWVEAEPCQILLLSLHLVMTKSIEAVLASKKPDRMSELVAHIEQRISILFILLNMRVSEIARKKYELLIASYTHFATVLDKIRQSSEQPTSASFMWNCQLRAYWGTADGKEQVVFRQLYSEIFHDFEFLGDQRLFVISPEFNRHVVSITNAVHNFTNCEIFGGSGVGKTALARHLANAFGKIAYTVQCLLPCQSAMLINALIGSAICSGWLFVENSLALGHETLSILATHIETLKNMRGSKDDHVMLDGQAIHTTGIFQVFPINSSTAGGKSQAWKLMNTHFRQVHIMQPDMEEIYVVVFASAGFRYSSQIMGKKWLKLSKVSKDHLKQSCHNVFTLRILKQVLLNFGKSCNGERNEVIFWDFVSMFFRTVLEESVHAEFHRVLFGVVAGREPAVVHSANLDSECNSKETCKEQTPLPADLLLAGIVAAYLSNREILILGEAASGKSSVLNRLKNHLIHNDITEGNKIERTFETIFPNTMEHSDFIGGYDLKTKKTTDGILTEVLRRSCSEKKKSTTIIFDGNPCTTWTDYLIGYIESKNSVVISSNEILHFAHEKPRLIVETDSVMNAAPSFLDRLSTFFVQNESSMPFDFIAEDIAACFRAEVATQYVDFAWTGLFSKPFLMECIDFVHQHFSSSQQQSPRLHVTACIKLFTSLVRSKYALLNSQKLDIQEFMKKAFMIAVIWTVGGTPLMEERLKFTDFFRSRYGTLDLPRFPNSASVYDYFINPETMVFCHCKDYAWCGQPEHFVAPFCIASVLMETQSAAVVILGQKYSGKSSLMRCLRSRMIQILKPEVLMLAFTGQTTATDVRCVIDSNLHRISKTVFGSTNGSSVLIEVDDMSATQNRGTMNSATECIRQLLDGVDELRPRGTFLDMSKNCGRVANVQLTAAHDSQIQRNHNSRLLRHFIRIYLKPLSTENMKQMFEQTVEVGEGRPQAKDFLTTFTVILFDCFKSIGQFWQTNRDEFWSEPTIHDCTRIMNSVADDVKSNDVSEMQWADVSMYHLSTVFMGMATTLKSKEHINASLRLLFQNVYPTNPNTNQELYWFSFGTSLNPHPSTKTTCETTREWITEEISRFNSDNSPPMKIHLSNDLIQQMAAFAKALTRNGNHLLVSSPSGYHKYCSFRLLSSMMRYTFWEFDLKLQSRDALKEIIGRIYVAVGAEQDKALMCVKIDFAHPWNSDTLSMLSDLHSLIETGDPASIISYEDRRKVVEMAVHNSQSTRSSIMEYSEILDMIRTRLLTNFRLIFVANAGENQMREQLFGFPAFIKKMTIFTKRTSTELREQDETVNSLVNSLFGSSLNGNAKSQIAKLLGVLHKNVLQADDRFSRSNLISCAKVICREISNYDTEQESKQMSLKASIKRVQEIADHLCTNKFQLQELEKEAEITRRQNDELEKLLTDAQSDLASVRETVENLLSERKLKHADLQLAQEKVRIIMEPSQKDLQTCLQELRTLTKSSVNEFTSLENPEQCVQLVGILISLLFGESPDWRSLRKINSNEGLQIKLFNYDFSSIPPRLGRQILKIIEVSKLDVQEIEKVSNVGKVLARWLLACIATLKLTVEFAKEIAARDDLTLIVSGIASQIESQKPVLNVHKDDVESLQIKFDFSCSKFKSLKESAEKCESIIMRCSKLLEAFETSVADWQSQLDEQEELEKSYVVDFVLACFFVSYLGALDSKVRHEIMGKSFNICDEEQICYNQAHVNKCLVRSRIAYNEWIVCGLPANASSLENGLSIRSSVVWPLIHDPNDIASNWIKRMEQRKNLRIFSCSEIKSSLAALELAIIDGCPILLEDLPSEPPLWLSSLLARRSFTKYSKTELLPIEGREIAVGEGFRLYATCKCRFQDLSPFYFGAMTPVNFEVTLETAEATCGRILASWCMQQSSSYADQVDVSLIHSVKQLLEVEEKRNSILITPLATIVEDDSYYIAASQLTMNISMIAAKLNEVQMAVDAFELSQKKCSRASYALASLFIASQKLKLVDERFSVSFQWFQERVASLTEEVEYEESSAERLFQQFSSSLFQRISEMVPAGIFKSFVFDCAVAICESEGREFDFDTLTVLPKLCNCNISKSAWRFFVNRSKAQVPSASVLPEHPFLSVQQLGKLCAIDEFIPTLAGIFPSVYENHKSWRDWFENGRFAVQKNSPLASNSEPLSRFDSLVILCCVFPSNENLFMEEFCNSVFRKETFAHGLKCLSSKTLTNFANLSYFLVEEGAHYVDWKETIFEHLKFWGLGDHSNLQHVEYSAQAESQVERRLSHIIRAKQDVIIENAHQKFTWLRTILTKLSKELDEEFVSKVFVVLPPNKSGVRLAPFYDTSRKVHCTSKLEFKDNVKLNSEIVLNFESKVLKVCMRKALATFHSILGHEELFPRASVEISSRTLKNCLQALETLLASLVGSEMTEADENRSIMLAITAHYGGTARDDIELKRFLQLFNRCLQIETLSKHPVWNEKPDIDAFVKSLPTLAMLEFCGYRESKEFQTESAVLQNFQVFTSAAVREVAAIQSIVPAVILVKNDAGIDWFLRTEIGHYNAEIAAIKGILEDCLQHRPQTDLQAMQSVISSITQDQVPPSFPHRPPAGSSLRAYLSKLTRKRSYFLAWSQNGPPLCHDISVYYDVRSFLAHVCVSSNGIANEGYVFSLKVLRNENAEEITQVAAQGVFVEGLLACRCKWDGKRRRFCSNAVIDESCTKLPVCLLTPDDADANRRCLPLWTFPSDDPLNSTEHVIASIQVDIQDDSVDTVVASNAYLACKRNTLTM